MERKRENMEPGKRYRGYGFINEFKEFCFEPEQTGAHAGREKCICVRDGVRCTETKNLLLFKFNLEKENSKDAYFKAIAKVYNTIVNILKDYEV